MYSLSTHNNKINHDATCCFQMMQANVVDLIWLIHSAYYFLSSPKKPPTCASQSVLYKPPLAIRSL